MAYTIGSDYMQIRRYRNAAIRWFTVLHPAWFCCAEVFLLPERAYQNNESAPKPSQNSKDPGGSLHHDLFDFIRWGVDFGGEE